MVVTPPIRKLFDTSDLILPRRPVAATGLTMAVDQPPGAKRCALAVDDGGGALRHRTLWRGRIPVIFCRSPATIVRRPRDRLPPWRPKQPAECLRITILVGSGLTLMLTWAMDLFPAVHAPQRVVELQLEPPVDRWKAGLFVCIQLLRAIAAARSPVGACHFNDARRWAASKVSGSRSRRVARCLLIAPLLGAKGFFAYQP